MKLRVLAFLNPFAELAAIHPNRVQKGDLRQLWATGAGTKLALGMLPGMNAESMRVVFYKTKNGFKLLSTEGRA